MAFELTDYTEAHVATFTKRVEKHGDEDRQAVSMGLEITAENFLLDRIDPTLREALYKAKDETQENLPDVQQTTPVLRCNSVDRVALPNKHEGWTVEIDRGTDENEPMKLGGVTLKKFSVEPKQGGSVVLRLTLNTSDIDAERLGWLGMHHGESIWLKLVAPKVQDKPAPIDGSTEAFQKDHPDAGDLFSQEHGGKGPEEGGEDDEGGKGACGGEAAVPMPPPNLKAKICPTPGTLSIAPASQRIGSLTSCGGANPMPACLKISTHGKLSATRSRRMTNHPGGACCCCDALTHDPPIRASSG